MNRNLLRALAAAAALASSACSVAPLIKPENQLGVQKLSEIRAAEAAHPDESLKRYTDYLHAHEKFDKSLQSYGREFDSAMQTLSKQGLEASLDEIPADGLSYYYVRHLTAMCEAYLGRARVYAAKGDYPRAERAAYNALALADKRLYPWSAVLATEVTADGFALLGGIYKKEGMRGSALWAESQRRLAADRLLSDDFITAYLDLYRMSEQDEAQLKQANSVIAELNSQKSQQTMNAFAAGLQAAANVANQYQQQQIQNQANRQGYMSSDQSAQLQMLKLNQSIGNMMLAQYAGKAGKYGDIIMTVNAHTAPALLQQFSNPSAGRDPVAIVRTFTQEAMRLAPKDDSVAQQSAKVDGLASNLASARGQGDGKGAESTSEKLIPAMFDLAEDIRRIR